MKQGDYIIQNMMMQYNIIHDSLINKSKYKLYDKNFNYVIPSSNEVVYTFAYPNISINESNLLVNFIYLDNLETKRFATSNHEYLITTLEIFWRNKYL